MRTLVVSDIFGKTAALEKLVERLLGDTKIVDPYDGIAQHFDNEATAYRIFNEQVGLATYIKKLLHTVRDAKEPVQLLGFSVGASACWCIAAEPKLETLRQVVCFYGSQIRRYSELNPRHKTTLVFPREEPGFDVQTLARLLEAKTMVAVHETPYLHGFMNPCSANFDADGYEVYVAWLQDALDTAI